MISTTERPRGATAPWSPLKAIVVGGLLAGLFDMSYALIWFSGVKGLPWMKVPQSVAAGLIGTAAFDGGLGTVFLGLGLHWLISFVWATIFVVGVRRFEPALLR
jgi:predicted ABC-type sugar transport system permease subunit